jgi:hypothetical protein
MKVRFIIIISLIYFKGISERSYSQVKLKFKDLTKASEFYPAEDYHQDYYFKNCKIPYCHDIPGGSEFFRPPTSNWGALMLCVCSVVLCISQ